MAYGEAVFDAEEEVGDGGLWGVVMVTLGLPLAITGMMYWMKSNLILLYWFISIVYKPAETLR